MPNRTGLKWAAAIGLPALFYIAAASTDVYYTYRAFFAITMWAALAWALDILPDAVVGLLVPVFYILAKVATPAQVFSPWFTGVPWITLGGLTVGAVMMGTGLAKRLAYWWVIRLGSSFPRILAGLTVVGLVIAPLMPSALGKAAIMSVIGIGVCEVLGLAPKSRAASAVMLTCFLAVACPAMSYMTGGLHIAIVAGFLAKYTAQGLSWFAYAYHNWLLGVAYTLVGLGLVIVLLRPEQPVASAATLKGRYAELGPFSAAEGKAVALLVTVLVLLATDRLHGIDPAWIMVLAAAAFFLPGINLMDKDKLGRLGYPVLLLVTGAMSVGATAAAIGVSRWAAEQMAPLLSGTPFLSVMAAYLTGAVSAFFIQSVALAGAFTPPLIEAAAAQGLTPHAIVYAFLYGADQTVFPYQFAVLAFVFSYGYLALGDVVRVMVPRLAADTLLIASLGYGYWKLIGLL